MEKKGNRNSPLTKGSVTDSKKDGVSNKLWPRTNRRETAVTNISSKPDISRKPQSQRIKSSGKRPWTRGSGICIGAVARNEATGLENEENNHQVELGSVFSQGSKKQSLNHLLNFSYAPRGNYHHTDKRYEHGNGTGNRMFGSKKHKYNKEHFLQANCQFIVNYSGDYKQYLNNPDALVDWNLVEQVNVHVSEFPKCPICLSLPVAAKMTCCGHIYCWSCVLHYLSLSDKSIRKCPICFNNVHKNDLKSVVVIPHNNFNIADTITFKLMKRPKGCLVAYPVEATIKEDNILFNMFEQGSKDVYSKLLLANTEDILTIIDRERLELEEQLKNEDGPEKCFIEQAMVLLTEREKIVFKNVQTAHRQELASGVEKEMKKLKIGGFKEVNHTEGVVEGCSSSTPAKFHYFYQASDGQHMYLHNINAKMLEHMYGSLELSPTTVTGIILDKKGRSMTEEQRTKFRYLQHLPLTCQYEVAEIRLENPIINKETLEFYHVQIELIKKKRLKRAKEEKFREKRIEFEENRKMGKYAHPNLHLESNIQFPECGYEFKLRTESESTSQSQRSVSPDLITVPTSSNVTVDGTHAGPSFAKMVASEKKSAPTWPGLKSASSAFASPKLINVTGSKMKTTSKIRVPSDIEHEPEMYESVPPSSTSFGDIMDLALVQKKDDNSTQSSGKKKKKSKQKILFATNMGYSEK